MKKPLICTCKRCKKSFDKNEIKRSLGKDSFVYILNYCSAQCYTKDMMKS